MSDINFYERIKKYLKRFEICIRDSNYSGAVELSINLTRLSIVMDWDEGINISEFLEWLFLNLKDIYAYYEIEDEDLKDVNEKILRLINVLVETIPIEDDERKMVKIYKHMETTRAAVTKLQFKYWGEKRRKKKKEGMGMIRLPPLEEM